ncbi:PDZ domain-containing protein [Akkermansiaceae bacterium]|nr:PDZ domain-containing protein [Akkermansiaceae bacterium]
MNITHTIRCCALLAGLATMASAQRGNEEVPLMRSDEKKTVDGQTDAFNKALESVVRDAAESTVLIWGRANNPLELAYGTVIGDGTQVLTKWSQIMPYADTLYLQGGNGQEAKAEVAGIYTEEDLALLTVRGAAFTPAKFYEAPLTLGRFLAASRPSGKPGAFGVVGVLERNLRETDQAHLGILADQKYRGEGVRIADVQPEYGAAAAGIQAGDVILKIGDRAISGLQELKNAMSGKRPGDTIKILVDSAGKERSIDVRLSNRPVLGQFSGDRLNQMERMGGEPNRVRSGFSRVVQSDMQIEANRVGGPVADLDGRIVGITMARADRTRTYIMGSSAVMEMLKGKTDTVAEAMIKMEEERQQLAEQRRAMIPQLRAQGKPRDAQRMRRHLGDMERLIERMNREMEELGER